MPDTLLSTGDPLILTLAADSRLSQPDFTNDQIWELRLQGGEPQALVLQTTYGLRARWMRIFPRFTRKDKTYFDPTLFHTAPRILAVYPNFIRLSCAPFSGLDVQIEYWAVSSQVIACRIQLKNSSILKERLRLDWAVLLSHLEEGVGMSAISQGNTCYLSGRSSDLVPVLIQDGCSISGSGSYPALIQELDLYPGNVQTRTWVCATLTDEQSSLDLARQTLLVDWERQVARIELQNTSQMLEIHTGRDDWDAAFMLSQVTAAGLVFPGGNVLPHSSFVLARQPDLGYSFRGDGSDYLSLWKGQTALDTLFLASLVLPGGAELVEGLLENFLAYQDEAGRIDWRPNLAGQRSRHLAQPVLATLAWQVAAYLPDGKNWLAELYPALVKFIKAWFDSELDPDGNGYPCWEHPLQTGLEELPLYNPWQAAAQGVDIALIEAPALAAFLYRECTSLIKIARFCTLPEEISWLEKHRARLHAQLDASWDGRSGLFRYRDARSHASQEGGLLKNWQGSGKFPIRRTFKIPQRLQLQFTPYEENTRSVTIRLVGQDDTGEVTEEIGPRKWTWVMRQARVTTQTLFKSITQVEIEGSFANDLLALKKVNHQQEDISLFIPLWAGIPTKNQAQKMVETAFKGSFNRPFGAPLVANEQHPASPPDLDGVSPLWVNLVGEGLLAYGYRAAGVDLFSHTMDAITGSLKRYHTFREMYDAETGQPLGERNHLRGLVPLGFFLKLVGIQKITPQEILIDQFNPFPFTVTVKYRGMMIACHTHDAVVTFPTGQIARVSGPGPHRVCLE